MPSKKLSKSPVPPMSVAALQEAETPWSVELGDRVREKITGYEGIVDAIMDHLYQCRQVHILPQTLNKDGELRKGEWVDEPWVEILAKHVFLPRAAVEVEGVAVSGGPGRSQPRPRHVTTDVRPPAGPNPLGITRRG